LCAVFGLSRRFVSRGRREQNQKCSADSRGPAESSKMCPAWLRKDIVHTPGIQSTEARLGQGLIGAVGWQSVRRVSRSGEEHYANALRQSKTYLYAFAHVGSRLHDLVRTGCGASLPPTPFQLALSPGGGGLTMRQLLCVQPQPTSEAESAQENLYSIARGPPRRHRN